jgi:hypothetical protein
MNPVRPAGSNRRCCDDEDDVTLMAARKKMMARGWALNGARCAPRELPSFLR